MLAGFFTDQNASLMELLQKTARDANFVKCFSCSGVAFMVNPDFGSSIPTMFICGNDERAKQEVNRILDVFGWESHDVGGVEAARAIEALCMLWAASGVRNRNWDYAFKLLQS